MLDNLETLFDLISELRQKDDIYSAWIEVRPSYKYVSYKVSYILKDSRDKTYVIWSGSVLADAISAVRTQLKTYDAPSTLADKLNRIEQEFKEMRELVKYYEEKLPELRTDYYKQFN